MKFFADTASLTEIEYCFSKGVNDGITTNPKIIEQTAKESVKELGFEKACKNLLEKYPSVPVSLETDLRGTKVREIENQVENVKEVLLKQAYEIASWSKNAVIKIPVCSAGLLAAKELREKGIRTNITACMTPQQALMAADFGFGYVSLFANRMLDSYILELAGYPLEVILTNPNWKDLVSSNKDRYLEQAWHITLQEIAYVAKVLEHYNNGKPKVELIIGSIREPKDVYRIISAKPQIITIPKKIVEGIFQSDLEKIVGMKISGIHIPDYINNKPKNIEHPMTTYTLEEFEKSADLYRKKVV